LGYKNFAWLLNVRNFIWCIGIFQEPAVAELRLLAATLNSGLRYGYSL
jgi:hypothetical protein